MNRRAFLLSAVATPIAAALPGPSLAEEWLVNAGCVAPGSMVYAPQRMMWIDGNRTIQWCAIPDAEFWA